jgi:hypothetical protein
VVDHAKSRERALERRLLMHPARALRCCDRCRCRARVRRSALAGAVGPHPIRSVDVLPLDLALWTEAGYDANPEELRGTAEQELMNDALDTLEARSYGIAAIIDWNGNYNRGHALPIDGLAATLGALARYDATATPSGGLAVPYVPVRLGTATGADATLYVGGWAYVGNHPEGTGSKIASGILTTLVVVVAVVAVVAIVASLGKHGGGLGGLGHGGGGGGHAAAHGAVAMSRLHFGSGAHAARVATDVALDLADAFGHAAIGANPHPDWPADPALPHAGDSQMFLEMTLVDNHTGLALWHAHQLMPANAASSHDLERVAHDLMASLPPATR